MKAIFSTTVLSACLIALVAGCHKDAPPPAEPATNAAAAAPTAPAKPPAGQLPPQDMPAVARDYDATLFIRSLDYAKGRIAMKDYPAAREAIKALEGQSLNAQQRQMVQSVKAQIPGG